MIRSAVLIALALASCASPPRAPESEPDELAVARDLAYSHTWAVQFDGDGEVAGYVVEFGEVPEGIVDERLHPAGTVLIQDRDLATIGFITPGGRAYAFDDTGRTVDRGAGARKRLVSAFFGRTDEPSFASTHPGSETTAR